MDRQEFEELRWEAIVRDDPYLKRHLSKPKPGWWRPTEVFVPPSRGMWIRKAFRTADWDSIGKWHIFGGDLRWRPGWADVHLTSVDRVDIERGALEVTTDPPPDETCQRCRKSQLIAA